MADNARLFPKRRILSTETVAPTSSARIDNPQFETCMPVFQGSRGLIFLAHNLSQVIRPPFIPLTASLRHPAASIF